MLIQDRIRLIIKANNQSASEFADAIGIKRSNLSHVLSGRNKPSLDFLEKILNTYPNVNASWLITGETREGSFNEVKEAKNSAKEPSVSNEVGFTENVERIVIFYTDGTFKAFTPSAR